MLDQVEKWNYYSYVYRQKYASIIGPFVVKAISA